jgi:GWxTD domain-containing protein
MIKRYFLLFIAALLGVPTLAQRQRITYVNLMNRASSPQIFLDHLVLPNDDGSSLLAIIFRFDNDFLPYKKILPVSNLQSPDGAQYYTIVQLNAEIFEGTVNEHRSGSNKSDNVIVAARDFWIDTLYAKTFEETQSKRIYASGSLTTKLTPGNYNYVLQLSLMENTNERSSQNRNVSILPWSDRTMGEIILVKSPQIEDSTTRVALSNLAENVMFGSDFQALVHLPNFSPDGEYSVKVYKAIPNRRDTTLGELVHEQLIGRDNILESVLPTLSEGREPTLILNPHNNGQTFGLVNIPNSAFENSAYIIQVNKSGNPHPIARKFIRSYWPDMPASLLNLDIAIEHLKFILPENKVKQINSGTAAERESKFREFWKRQDPTPATVYNEKMAEYYRRIDYAFKEFGNQGNLAGHESDQGKVYINYGPPDDKERRFPPNGKVTEIWKYGNKRFIFEASTGFGDFVLIGTE